MPLRRRRGCIVQPALSSGVYHLSIFTERVLKNGGVGRENHTERLQGPQLLWEASPAAGKPPHRGETTRASV